MSEDISKDQPIVPLDPHGFDDTAPSALDGLLANFNKLLKWSQQDTDQPNRKERRKIERLNRVRSNRVARTRLRGSPKKLQQVDARGSTVNNVRGDQINIVVNTPTSAYIEEVEDNNTFPENLAVDSELNKYPPLVEFGLKVVMSTTNLVTTNITAAAAYIAEIPQTMKSNIQSITLKRTSFRYSFFSDEYARPCSSPVVAACPTCLHVLP